MKVQLPRRRGVVLAALVAALLVGAGLAIASRQSRPAPLPARSEAQRPVLMLLTTLPLVFPEQFALEGGGSPALTALETRYRVVPIGLADRADLRRGRLLLMAHPLAQPAEALVELDRWVRSGGRVLLLADPMLEWPSERPLGDPLRPPPMFADTGLLAHWGLRLDAPEQRGFIEREIDGRGIETSSVGQFVTTSGNCRVAEEGLVARCRIGKGRATVIADADLLNVGGDQSANLQFLLSELERIER